MIELVLVFFLGCLAAGLVWLLLLPAIWRRAERLTRARVERALPLDANEILAERDRERAAFAVQCLALENRMDGLREETLAAKAEVGQRLTLEAQANARLAESTAQVRALRQEVAELGAALEARDATIAGLTQRHDAASLRVNRLEEALRGLEGRLAEAAQQAEAQQRKLDEAEVLLHGARAAETEERNRNAALRAQLLALQHERHDGEHDSAVETVRHVG